MSTMVERSEIPDHIMEQAKEAWSRAFHVGPEIETIALALLAAEKRGKEEERERCAKIADEIADREERIWIEDDSESGRAADAAEEIAAAIRES